MSEQFFWNLLIIMIAAFASASSFGAGFYLLVNEFQDMFSSFEMTTALGLEHALFGVSNVPVSFVSVWRGNNIYVALIFLVLVIVIVVGYGWWLDRYGKVWLEARRLHKSMAAMLVVFGFVLFYAGYQMLKSGLVINGYSSTIIFLLSLVAMARWKTKIPLVVYFALAAVIVYFIH